VLQLRLKREIIQLSKQNGSYWELQNAFRSWNVLKHQLQLMPVYINLCFIFVGICWIVLPKPEINCVQSIQFEYKCFMDMLSYFPYLFQPEFLSRSFSHGGSTVNCYCKDGSFV
jgi:hypothetical protein